MQAAATLIAAALIAAALALGGAATLFGLAWPAWPRPTGARPAFLWAALGLVLIYAAPAPLGRWSLLPAGAVLIFLALADLRRFSLPIIGLVLLALAAALDLALQPRTAGLRLLTGAAAFLAFLALRHFTGRPPKLGMGDVLLAGLTALLIDWPLVPLAFALAALAPLALQRLTRRTGPVPFGFWLSAATLIAASAS